MPRQDKRVDCRHSQDLAVLGQIAADRKERDYGNTTNGKMKVPEVVNHVKICPQTIAFLQRFVYSKYNRVARGHYDIGDQAEFYAQLFILENYLF